jgi:hypothetical protein
MTQAIEEKNKAFVLEAFETLFNKKDYAAAERFFRRTGSWRISCASKRALYWISGRCDYSRP